MIIFVTYSLLPGASQCMKLGKNSNKIPTLPTLSTLPFFFTNMRCTPTPDSRFPIPDSRFPTPDSRFPIPF
ncbi:MULTISPECIES: hypothetical protein [Moorena]|uniref:hypothetical protein n=1 Tax=Moorena TaxID=1155738 RepID=UPI0002EE8EED|nr:MULTISPECIES: hypothetical protein [Moorena]NEP35347.1 hypothetical protein [Moorena sp. SIO3B2]NEP65153.1 hypothetical protein [Moorena sp. SIO3A5]NEQ09508.1 hypothetical protein [Moorena sp. SIO4E2]NER87867.1 hypothetical protein [Moorena sp. SIO3A2]NET63586.1 hypothetical protein [Moorena sp. SIO1G6]